MLRILPLLVAALCLGMATPARAAFLDCLFTQGFEDSGTTQSQPADALQLHNCARRTVVPAAATPIEPMTWSSANAIVAQAWSDACVYGHSHLPGYGENIYAAAGFTPTLKTAVARTGSASSRTTTMRPTPVRRRRTRAPAATTRKRCGTQRRRSAAA
jgi:hypothetical protein